MKFHIEPELQGEKMAVLRSLRVRLTRRLSTRVLMIAIAVLVCWAIYAYMSLQRDENQSLPPRRQLLPDRSAVPQFRAGPDVGGAGKLFRQKLKTIPATENTMASGSPLDIPRVAEYCNIPVDVQEEDGEEGEVPAGYSLVAAHVVIRHGDRTPMNTVMDIPRPQPREGCVMNKATLLRHPGLRKFLFDMAVSRDKQPGSSVFAKWALFPQHRECSSSELTGRGALQHLINGLVLKEKYVKKWNLFGSRFSPAAQLKLASTQSSRTYQSAIAFLYGFLPQFDIKQLNIMAAEDTKFCHSKYVPEACCSVLPTLWRAFQKSPNDRGRNNPKYNSALAPLADVFETKISRLPYPAGIIDMLQGHACHTLRLPCGKSGRCVSAFMMRDLWDLLDSDGQSLAVDEGFHTFARIAMRSLLLQIATDMKEAAGNHTDIKFALYSGHDITISPLLQALGLYNGKWPKYATRLVFELYQKNNMPRENYIRILYDGHDVTFQCRLCRHGLNSDKLCRFEDFQQALARDVDDITKGQSLQSFCDSQQR